MPRYLPLILSLTGLLSTGPGANAGGKLPASDWCYSGGWDEGARHCEVREVDLGAARSFAVNATPNGGIEVIGGDEAEARLLAKVEAQAATEAEARDLAGQVQVATHGTIRASGPSRLSKRYWSVSYRLRIPRQAELDLEAANGGIHIRDVNGTIRFRTVNGGVHLEGVGGDVRGHTVNGGLHVKLEGAGWEGAGLEASTSNGGISLAVSEGYRAHLETGTVNGHLDVDSPVTMRGRIGKSLALELGGGGPPLRVRTTNGGVKVRRLP